VSGEESGSTTDAGSEDGPAETSGGPEESSSGADGLDDESSSGTEGPLVSTASARVVARDAAGNVAFYRFDDGVMSDGEVLHAGAVTVRQSPTGRWLLIEEAGDDPDWISEVVGGEPRPVTELPVQGSEHRFLPDDTALVSLVQDGDDWTYVLTSLSRGFESQVLATAGNADFDFRVYAEGITFVERPSFPGSNAFFARLDASGAVQLSDVADGEYIDGAVQLLGSGDVATYVASTDGLYEVFIADTGTGTFERVHELLPDNTHAGPAAPDGSAFTYVVGPTLGVADNQLYVVPVADGEPVLVGSYDGDLPNGPIAWSPDSRWLAFAYSNAGGTFDLAVVDFAADTLAPQEVATIEREAFANPPRLRFGDLSQGLYYDDDLGVHRVDLTGDGPGDASLLYAGASRFHVSREETSVLIDDGDGGLWQIDANDEMNRIDDESTKDRTGLVHAHDGSAAVFIEDGRVAAVGLDTPGDSSSSPLSDSGASQLYVLPD